MTTVVGVWSFVVSMGADRIVDAAKTSSSALGVVRARGRADDGRQARRPVGDRNAVETVAHRARTKARADIIIVVLLTGRGARPKRTSTTIKTQFALAGEGKLDPIEDDGLSIQLKLDAIEAQAPKALLATPQRR